MNTYRNHILNPTIQNQKYLYPYKFNNNLRLQTNNITYYNQNQNVYQQVYNQALTSGNVYHQRPKTNQIIKRNITPNKKIIPIESDNRKILKKNFISSSINFSNYKVQIPSTINKNNKVIQQNELRVSHNKSPPKIQQSNEQPVDYNNNSFLFNVNKLNQKISFTNENNLKRSLNIEKSTNANNFFRLHCECSQAGRNQNGEIKTNQDNFLVKIKIKNIPGFNIFGVLDGHGKDGHYASKFAKEYILLNLEKLTEKLCSNGISTAEKIYQFFKKDNFSIITQLYKNIDIEIQNQKKFDYIFSGTTCNIIFQFNNHLLCANVGDSRSILIFDNNQNLQTSNIFNFSYDHKPNINEECERILKHGGTIHKLLDKNGKILGGPLRVFKKNKNYPGLAMTRSLGDLNAKSCGVINLPQIIEYDLNSYAKYMVICSDGIWEFLSNEMVTNIGNKYFVRDDIGGHCMCLIHSAMKMWESQDIIRDDITVVVVYF